MAATNRAPKPQMNVYSVRIDFETGMERMDVSALDRLDAIVNTVTLLRMKERNTGVHRIVTAITIEGV